LDEIETSIDSPQQQHNIDSCNNSESFMDTATKLLEKVKQQQQQYNVNQTTLMASTTKMNRNKDKTIEKIVSKTMNGIISCNNSSSQIHIQNTTSQI
jgi:hypothetical protein